MSQSYPMRVAQQASGLTAHTIRVWERRYGAVRPKRTKGGSRRYSDQDINRLILLRKAVEQGYRIGKISRLSDDELIALSRQSSIDNENAAQDQALGLQKNDSEYETIKKRYLQEVMRFDATKASDILTRAASILRREPFLFEVILPILHQVGELWENNVLSPAQEHLVSSHIRGILGTILHQYDALIGAPGIVVSTPTGQLHEFGALIGALLAAVRGMNVVYLGPNLPEKDLSLAVKKTRADILLLAVLSSMESRELFKFNQMLSRLSRQITIWVGLPSDHKAFKRVKAVTYFDSFKSLDNTLISLKRN